MNNVRQIQDLNRRELENDITPEASWHADYRDTAYIYIGGLPFELSEGDVITIFSQFGEPTFISLARDKETGKSKGFAFLKYGDQRSTDLAVDNLGGATIMGRTLRVDHTRYKKREENTEDEHQPRDLTSGSGGADEETYARKISGSISPEKPLLKEEVELQRLLQEHDDDDPMKAFLVEEKRKEIAQLKGGKESKDSHRRRRHHQHHSHRTVDIHHPVLEEHSASGPHAKNRQHRLRSSERLRHTPRHRKEQ